MLKRIAAFVFVGFFVSLTTGCQKAPDATPQPAVTEGLSDAAVADEYVIDAADFVDHTVVQVPTGDLVLSDEERTWLRTMREEEMLAHDLYTALYEKWNVQIFANIARSERTHTDAIARLLALYKVDDPASGHVSGVFENPDLQALYDALLTQGMASLEDALRVGATIEDVDIVDLDTAMAVTDETAILTVYANLQKGSRNHLRAFNRQLEKRTGQKYEPQYLSQEDFDAIISAPQERGRAAMQEW